TQIATAINQLTGTHGVTANAGTTTATITAANFGTALTFNDVGNDSTLHYTLQINDVQVAVQIEDALTITSQSDLITLINTQAASTGVTATLQANNDILLSASDGRNIEFAEAVSNASGGASDGVNGFLGDLVSEPGASGQGASVRTFKAAITLDAKNQIVVNDLNDGGSDQFFSQITNNSSSTTNAAAIVSANVLTAEDSNNAIRSIDQAIRDVDTLRGTFGAIQTRFESTIASLATSAENLSAARSRIQDTDFAQQTAELTRSQILQQAGTAMLAQANSSPQSVLSLLQ
ncbi:MAG: hypothetical protein KUG52_07790, partial [Immundisolibacteraceae bacterium]|nr:hypothetical protein [Immundisolibacteraceae bacterium]